MLNEVRVLLAPRPASELMRWKLRLYCGHVIERTAHASHKTVHAAFCGSAKCPECGLDPAAIVAAKPIGLVSDLASLSPPKPALPTPAEQRAALQRSIRKAEREAVSGRSF